MPKPATLPEIATDTNFSTSPAPGVNGTPTKVEPTEDQKDEGFVPGTGFVGQHWNWYLHNIYTWVQYLNGIEAEDFDWTGVHTFTQDIVTDGDVTCDNVVANGGVTADGGHFADLEIGSPVKVQIEGGGGTIVTEGGVAAASFTIPSAGSATYGFSGTLPVFQRAFSFAGGQGSNVWGPDASHPDAIAAPLTSTSDTYYKPIELPEGCIVQTLQVCQAQASNAATDMKVELVYKSAAGGAYGADTPVASVSPSLFGVDSVDSVTGLSHTVSTSGRTYFLKVTGSDNTGGNNAAYYARISAAYDRVRVS